MYQACPFVDLCFQVVVVCLVILDAIFVLAELLIDLSVIQLEHGHLAPEVRCKSFFYSCEVSCEMYLRKCKFCTATVPQTLSHRVTVTLICPQQIFHYLSLALLTFFMLELAGKLVAYHLEFFQHKFEVFDGLVVVVSFVLDIVFIFHEDAFDGMGLLILLRLWRVARIING